MTLFVSRLPSLAPGDRRLNPAVEPGNAGRKARVIVPVIDLRHEPRPDCALDSQLMMGDPVTVFAEENGWAYVQSETDGYVGWTASGGLAAPTSEPNHLVCVPRTFVYPGPDLRFPATAQISMGSLLSVVGTVETRGTGYALLASGEALIASHLRPATASAEHDPVLVAQRLIGTPYLWGGITAFGLDCSGLVQLSMRMCGKNVLRDSDMQAATLGAEIQPGGDYANLRHGDLIFWKGHVGFVEGNGHLLHASGHSMLVTSEPLSNAIARIAGQFDQPIGFRRPARQ